MTIEVDYASSGIPEGRWRELAQSFGCDEVRMRFVIARHNGATPTASARIAGILGKANAIKQAGFRMARETPVTNLLAAAAAETGHSGAGITETEVDAKLAKMIRSADMRVAGAGIELRDKRAARAREQKSGLDDDGFSEWRFVRDIIDVPFAAPFLLGLFCDEFRIALSRVTMFHEIYWRALRDAPAHVEKIRARQSAVMLQDLEERIADDNWQREAREKIWGEIDVGIDAADAAVNAARFGGNA